MYESWMVIAESEGKSVERSEYHKESDGSSKFSPWIATRRAIFIPANLIYFGVCTIPLILYFCFI